MRIFGIGVEAVYPSGWGVETRFIASLYNGQARL